MAITTINGNAGSDLITLLGSEYPDSLTIDSNNLYVNTREGKDTITGSSTVEYVSIESGESNDTLTFTSEVVGSNFKLGNGDDNLIVNDFSGSIYGGTGKDSIEINQSRTLLDSLIRGDGGNDQLNLGNIANSIINTNGDDDTVTINGNLVEFSNLYWPPTGIRSSLRKSN